MNEYKKIAEEILSVETIENKFKEKRKSLDECILISNDFYNNLFGNKIKYLDDKVVYIQNNKLKYYDGNCKITKLSSYAALEVTISIPNHNIIRLAITLTHERAHAFHIFENKSSNEFIPSFLDLLNSIILDNLYPQIKNDNLNYKINQAKKAAKIYLKYCKKGYDDVYLINQINYMLSFTKMLTLTKEYFENDSELIINMVEENLFSKKNDNKLENYLKYKEDNSSIENKIKFIKNI